MQYILFNPLWKYYMHLKNIKVFLNLSVLCDLKFASITFLILCKIYYI